MSCLAIIYSCTNYQEKNVSLDFSMAPVDLSFEPIKSTKIVTINSDYKWSIVRTPDWLSVTSISNRNAQSYEWVVSFTCEDNKEYDREGTLSISTGDYEVRTYTVTQRGEKGAYVAVESVTIEPSNLTLTEKEYQIIVLSFSPTTASEKIVSFTSSDPSVAYAGYSSVGQNPFVHARSEGRTTITATTKDGTKTAICSVVVTKSYYSATTPDAIDLGLPSGTKWASFNLGATTPEEDGDYFAWGEIEPYYRSLDPLVWKNGKSAGYNEASYKFYKDYKLTKYCSNSSSGYDGFYDGITTLDSFDDAASVHLGRPWRIPTEDDWVELYNKCTFTKASQGGKEGYKITSRSNGKSIFLPIVNNYIDTTLGGVGLITSHWSSSLNKNSSFQAYSFVGNSALIDYRWSGKPIRPVSD